MELILSSECHNSACPDNLTTTVREDGECYPGFFCRSDNGCGNFGDSHGDIIRKSKDDKNLSSLLLGYCMTYVGETNSSYIIACPYDIAKRHSQLVRRQTIDMDVTLDGLNTFTCGQFNRTKKHCARCQENTGQSIFTLDLSCYSCECRYSGWSIYFLFEFIPLTAFIFLLLLFQLSPTKPNIKSFVLFSQLTMVSLSLQPTYNHLYNGKTSILVKIIKTCYGFWNLDFFRSVIPPFCVHDDLNNFEVLSFHYISIIYPTILTVVAWIIVDLHERGCKLVVRMWGPFRRYLSRYPTTGDPKRTIVSFFAGIVVLSYTKVIYISANLLNVVNEYTVCNKNSEKWSFLQPDIKYFSPKHAPFAVLALLMMFFFVVLPLLLLLLYPIGCFQTKLKSFCVRHSNIQIFVESFHGCYFDGSNGGKDRRMFSTVYLFHRLVVVLILVKSVGNIAGYILTASAHGLIVGLLFAFRPYKQEAYTYLDILFFTISAMICLFTGVSIHNNSNPKILEITFTGIFIAMLVPLLYASIRVLIILVRWMKLIDVKSYIQQRRRGYVEISDYGSDLSTSTNETERHRMRWQHRHWTREEKDSLQSE